MSDRERAREKALQAARAVTLGLAIAGTTAGCDAVIERACVSVAENTRYCCDRRGFFYDDSAGVCRPPPPVPGPFVPPDLPA